jgi:hypothetical protein
MTPPFPFRRVVIAGTDPEFDAELVNYGGGLASLGPDTELVVLSRTSRALQSFALAPRLVLAAHGAAVAERVNCRIVVEPDLDGLLASVAEVEADLMIVRPPDSRARRRQTLYRLAAESPCSVCLVPRASPPFEGRVIAGIEPDDAGAAVLRAAACICKGAGSSEFVAVRTWLGLTMDPSEGVLDRLREREWLNLFQFLQRVDLHGADCTPRVEECSKASTAILRVAQECQADLIVVAAPEGSRTPFPDRRPYQEELMMRCPVPLLVLRSNASAPGLRNTIRRLFSGPEPAFG